MAFGPHFKQRAPAFQSAISSERTQAFRAGLVCRHFETAGSSRVLAFHERRHLKAQAFPRVICHVSCVMCQVLCVMPHASCVLCHMSYVMCHVSGVMYYVAYVMRHVSCVMCRVPYNACVVCHMSWFMCHVSCVICHVHMSCSICHNVRCHVS
jgi:hypothetical protein